MSPRASHAAALALGALGAIAAQHAITPAQAAPRADVVRFEPGGGIDLAVQLGADRMKRGGVYVTPAGGVEVNGKPSTDAHALNVGQALRTCAQVVMTEVPQMADQLTPSK